MVVLSPNYTPFSRSFAKQEESQQRLFLFCGIIRTGLEQEGANAVCGRKQSGGLFSPTWACSCGSSVASPVSRTKPQRRKSLGFTFYLFTFRYSLFVFLFSATFPDKIEKLRAFGRSIRRGHSKSRISHHEKKPPTRSKRFLLWVSVLRTVICYIAPM